MPTYCFFNKDSGEEWTEIKSISSMEKYLAENPNIELRHYSSHGLLRSHGQKPDDSFRDILRVMKKKHRGSTINTF